MTQHSDIAKVKRYFISYEFRGCTMRNHATWWSLISRNDYKAILDGRHVE